MLLYKTSSPSPFSPPQMQQKHPQDVFPSEASKQQSANHQLNPTLLTVNKIPLSFHPTAETRVNHQWVPENAGYDNLFLV